MLPMMDKWNWRHLRTRHNGVVTVAFQQVDRYTYRVKFAFCSPEDTFSKKRGRMEALGLSYAEEGGINKQETRSFIVYRPEGYSLDATWIDFLEHFYCKSSFRRSKNRRQFENEIRWPRWLPEFIWSWRFGFIVTTNSYGWFPSPTVILEYERK